MSERVDITRLVAPFTSERRLYDIEGDGPLSDLLVEQFSLIEELNRPWHCELVAVSQNAGLNHHAMPGKRLTLVITLADGERRRISGIVTRALRDGGDGAWGRYRLSVQAGLALLRHARSPGKWLARSVIDIVDDLLGQHPLISWRWAADIGEHLAQSPFANDDGVRAGTTTHLGQIDASADPSDPTPEHSSDLAFLERLLAEEGINYRFEPDEGAPTGQTVVFFADSASAASCPEDPTSEAAGSIAYHRNDPTETQDTLQTFGAVRTLTSGSVSTSSWDPIGKRVVASRVPSLQALHPSEPIDLELYDTPGAHAFTSIARAERAALLIQQSIDARRKRWFGRSSVRTFSAGHTFALTGSPLDDQPGEDDETRRRNRHFLITRVVHHGINNLPRELGERLREPARASALLQLPEWVAPELHTCAQQSGYANHLHASRSYLPWRPALEDGWDDAQSPKLRLRPSAHDCMEAWVCAEDGRTQPRGADELHMDRLGRVRIRFDFQDTQQGRLQCPSSDWVRVAQPYAGAGMGMQFIPRIGQRVLVGFEHGHIDRPIVLKALHTGRGEGGVPATPGGRAAQTERGVFARSSDASPAGQANLTGGASPAWHGASPEEHAQGGQRNAAALSGFKSKEFGRDGFNQLVFDDSNEQLRVQAGSTQWASWLHLGHLIHQSDNHRGSFRGLGWELRTDAYGALRAAGGVLLSTYGTSAAEPAGDNAAGIALVGQLKDIAQTFGRAAQTHQSVAPSAWLGSFKPNRSALSDGEAPLAALHTALKGMVDPHDAQLAAADAAAKNTSTADKLPHTTDPIAALAGKAGIVQAAGQDLQLVAGENITLGAGQDIQLGAGGASRLHTGQAIGILGGAIKPGDPSGDQSAGTGVTMIAAQGDIDLQAQAGAMQIASQQRLQMASAQDKAVIAAPKRIVIANSAGASLTIEGGNITFACPGQITVHAGSKSLQGPGRVSYAMPVLPTSEMRPIKFGLSVQDIPGAAGATPIGQPWHIVVTDVRAIDDGGIPPEIFSPDHWSETLFSGTVAASGAVTLTEDQQRQLNQRVVSQSGKVWFVSGVTAMPLKPARWTGGSNDVVPEKILDALNFASDGRGVDTSVRDWLAEHAKADANVPGLYPLKPNTDA